MIYLALFIIVTMFSQVLLKKASEKNAVSKSYLINMIKSPSVIIAYGCNFVNVFVWIMALSEVSLLFAFLSTSSIFILMIIVDAIFFKEPVNFFKYLGAGFICLGVIVNFI
jgi:multidrug transporter EmrE-like cation transporter